jgi:hypothetical protein
MVGGKPAVSPNDRLVLLEGNGACANPPYDHLGCISVPGHVFHLVRAADRQILRSFSYPIPSGPEYFVDNKRLLVLGNSISVVDASGDRLLESLRLDETMAISAIFSADRRRLWVGLENRPALLGFDLEKAMQCQDRGPTPEILFAGDGSTSDTFSSNGLAVHGHVGFSRIDQLFQDISA